MNNYPREVWVYERTGEDGRPSLMQLWFEDDLSGAEVRFEGGNTDLTCQ